MIDPREYIAAETLKDGLAVTIRALRPDDRREGDAVNVTMTLPGGSD